MIDIKLYWVSTIVPVFRAHKDVYIVYFIGIVPGQSLYAGRYGDLIKDYKGCEDKAYPENYIDELFTLEQAEQFVDWHKKKWPGLQLSINEIDLPIPCDSVPLSAIPVGGLSNAIDFVNDEEYDLPFKVLGFYNLERFDAAIGANVGTAHYDEEVETYAAERNQFIVEVINKMIDAGILPKGMYEVSY